MNEQFRTLPASLGITTKTRLQQPHRRFSMRESSTVISTSITTGWLATATLTEIRLYDLDSQDYAREIVQHCEFSVMTQSKNEKIRAVAISHDLLAVVTHHRLLIFAYTESKDVKETCFEDVRIDLNEAWTPKSVSIMQVESTDTLQSAAAWIAVGGEGINGVKLYQYSRSTGWNAHRNRTVLKCPRNTSSVCDVGFSQFVRNNRFFVFGVTSENRIFCWIVCPRETASPIPVSGWELDGNLGQNSLSQRAGIAAVSIFESPSEKPYIFCAVDQKHGSQQLRSFIAPLDSASIDPDTQWRPLPEKVAGRHVLGGAVTPNGRFLVTVEEGVMRLLTLRGSCEGGLTCQEQNLAWHSSLKGTAKDVSVISLFTKEREGGLNIVAVDGRGHLVFARVSVPEMPVSRPLSITRRANVGAVEMPAGMIVKELHGDLIEDEIRVMLG
ncbi:hypothetical protein P280DRAFT_413431 [Massarina eburnea CBS 473.64]|uniref:WD40 repeat-like protein n=1 Tax=Massarina eburnea CBS 473.64 TaxID=1395130 RepID=A0A6A6RH80_9PLEO|nr:hypothetical protein P280DRAFT_413431 [Massarina eburnea CBS 473.64]